MRSCNRLQAAPLLLALALPAAGPPPAEARPDYLEAWVARYPESTIPQRMLATTGSECRTCHHPPIQTAPGTCYREEIRTLILAGVPIEEALAIVEFSDSDGDGVVNIVEILYEREDLPGEIGFHPGLVGDLGTDPCGTDPDEVVSGQPETPPNPAGADDREFEGWPGEISLHPNPAVGGRTVVRLRSPGDRAVSAAVFDPAGRQVRALASGRFAGGIREIAWNGRDEEGRDLPAGIYYVRIQVEGEPPRSRSLILIR